MQNMTAAGLDPTRPWHGLSAHPVSGRAPVGSCASAPISTARGVVIASNRIKPHQRTSIGCSVAGSSRQPDWLLQEWHLSSVSGDNRGSSQTFAA
jgi:hypothetical protein